MSGLRPALLIGILVSVLCHHLGFATVQHVERSVPAGAEFDPSLLNNPDFTCAASSPFYRPASFPPGMKNSFEGPNFEVVKKKSRVIWPGDPDIAAGPNNVLVVVNSLVAIYTKTVVNVWTSGKGGCVAMIPLAKWFANVAGGGADRLMDPRIVYDALQGHWVIIALLQNYTSNRILVSVSQGSDPLGKWWNWTLDGTLTYGVLTIADAPDVGFDSLGAGGFVYVTSDQFSATDQTFQTAALYMLPKNALYSGGSFSCYQAWNARDYSLLSARALRPARTLGFAVGAAPEYLLSTQDTSVVLNSDAINIWEVIPAIPPVAFVWNQVPPAAAPSIGTYTAPYNATQSATTCGSASLNTRTLWNQLFDTTWQGDRLYAAFDGKSGTGWSSVRYFSLSTTDWSVAYNRSQQTPGTDFFMPAIAPDGSGNIFVSHARAGSSDLAGGLASMWFTRQNVSTEPGPEAPGQVQGGAVCLGMNARWGDYFGAAQDPSDDRYVWLVGEFSREPAYTFPMDASWGTYVARVTFAPDVSMSCSPVGLTVSTPGASTSTCTLHSLNGFAGSVSMSASTFPALPADVSFDFAPSTVALAANGSATTDMTVTAASSAVGGKYTLHPTGSGGAIPAVDDVQVVVSAGVAVNSITPDSGNTSGGTTVVLAGSGFQASAVQHGNSFHVPSSPTMVSIGGVPASVVAVTSTTLTAVTGPHPQGPVDVVVTNPTQGTSFTLTGGYTYSTCPDPPAASNSGPACVGQTIDLTASSPQGGTYSWRGPNGFTSTEQNPTIQSAGAAAAGWYVVTVTLNSCESLAGTTLVTVNPDTTPPAVTPPSSTVVDQTTCCGTFGGATSLTCADLGTFLAGGSATDGCTAAPARLTPQVAGADVTGSRCFETGATLVTFRFQDVAGNIGSATATATVRMFGDLNLDNVVDPSDMVILRAYFNFVLAPGSPPFLAPLGTADLTHEGIVDPSDMVVLRAFFNFAVGCLAP